MRTIEVTIDNATYGVTTSSGSVGGGLAAANNLSDVADQQTALDTLTDVSSTTDEYVLTKDTATGNAIFKVAAGAGGGDPDQNLYETFIGDSGTTTAATTTDTLDIEGGTGITTTASTDKVSIALTDEAYTTAEKAEVAANTAASHAEAHTVVSHSDTTATGAELDELTDGSETTLHSHAGGGSGDVVGPASAVDSNIAAFDTTTGKLIKDSGVAYADIGTNTAHITADGSSHADVAANTLKDTNVTTNLSEGTSTTTTVDVNSSDGTNATLVAASTTRAGLLTKAKWDEIVANTAASHAESHTVASHSDTTATGTELETLTDGSNADALHVHAAGGGDLLAANNLSDVAAQQTAVNNVTAVSAATNEHVLTKDTGTGNAIFKAAAAAAPATDSITNVHLANMVQATIKGRADAAGTDDPQDLTAAQVRTIINVEDGATADQSDAEIKTAYENNADTNAFTDTNVTSVAAIAANTAHITSDGSAHADVATNTTHRGLTSGAHGATGTIVGTTDTQTLSAKTLTTPTIGDFTNATHDHADAAGGGVLDIADLSITESLQIQIELTVGEEIQYVAPFDMSITGWTMLLNVSGSAAIDVWKDTYANYPPLDADSIVTPSVTTDTDNQATGLSIAVTAGDILIFHVDSVTTSELATLALTGVRT